VGRGKNHRCAMIQTIHDGYNDAVAMEERIVDANATVDCIQLLSDALMDEKKNLVSAGVYSSLQAYPCHIRN
jgi:hypothetical protein